MKAGELDRRVVIQKLRTTKDASGYRAETWSTLATVWAKKIEESGDEKEEAGQIYAVSKVAWEIRYRDDVKVTYRLSWNGDYYDIVDVQEIGRQDGLKLITEKRPTIT